MRLRALFFAGALIMHSFVQLLVAATVGSVMDTDDIQKFGRIAIVTWLFGAAGLAVVSVWDDPNRWRPMLALSVISVAAVVLGLVGLVVFSPPS